MRTIFKFLIIFICLWVGTRSVLSIPSDIDYGYGTIIDILLYIIFVGTPAANYWGNSIDKAFSEPEEENKTDINN